MGNFSIPWDCPDCGCGDVPCDYYILQITVHVTRDADAALGLAAVDTYANGYLRNGIEGETVGKQAYNTAYGDTYGGYTFVITEEVKKLCFENEGTGPDDTEMTKTKFWYSLSAEEQFDWQYW